MRQSEEVAHDASAAEDVRSVSTASFNGLLIISLIAVAAPILAASVKRVKLPSVVLEIVAGIIIGPSVLRWVKIDQPVRVLALLGLAFLLFLAGLEIRQLSLASVRGFSEIVNGLAAYGLRREVRAHPGGDLLGVTRAAAEAVRVCPDEVVHLMLGYVVLKLGQGGRGVGAVEAADRHDRLVAGQL
jgi:hypothetical protein